MGVDYDVRRLRIAANIVGYARENNLTHNELMSLEEHKFKSKAIKMNDALGILGKREGTKGSSRSIRIAWLRLYDFAERYYMKNESELRNIPEEQRTGSYECLVDAVKGQQNIDRRSEIKISVGSRREQRNGQEVFWSKAVGNK